MRGKALPPPSGSEGHRRLAELAERQHRVVSIRQLRGPLGYSEGAVERMVKRAHLHRLHRGVYAVGTASVSMHGACLAAVLACGPGALLSHRSAAWLWGLTRRRPFPLEVTSPTPRAPRPPIRLRRARRLMPADRALVAVIPVTSLSRTLLDYAATVNAERLEKGLERAEELELFDLTAAEELLSRSIGHRGHKPLAHALELYRPAPFTRSGMERHFLDLVEEAGLPKPATGFNELGHELDVYWPEHRLVIELDLFETHGTRAAFERDRLRQEDLLLDGIRMMRVTGPRLDREPHHVIERVRRLLARRP